MQRRLVMKAFETLEDHLQTAVTEGNIAFPAAVCIRSITVATRKISKHLALGPLAGGLPSATPNELATDHQKVLNAIAGNLIVESLRKTPLAFLALKDRQEPIAIKSNAYLSMAVDPLEGGSNLKANAAAGTIFSIYSSEALTGSTPGGIFLQKGTRQIAAGYCIYGIRTVLVLTIGSGTHIFTLEPDLDRYFLTTANVNITAVTRKLAIDIPEICQRDPADCSQINNCLVAEAGLQGHNYDVHRVRSLVAECHRILSRGGIILYPGNRREDNKRGRMSLLYGGKPIALLIEQAAGRAISGKQRILDIKPERLNQRIPMIAGSSRGIRCADRFDKDHQLSGEYSQLFSHRGLFRA